LSERELGKVEDMTGNKFKKAMENIKLQLVPVGKAFLQAATPIVNFVGKILEKFNNLSDGTKKVIAIVVAVLGAVAPVALMTFGVLVNGIANVIKFFAMLRGGIAKLNGQNNVLGGGFDYLTNQQTELLAETNALHTSHQQLLSTFNVEKTAVDALALAYGNAASQARALATSSPGLFNSVPGPAGAVAGLPPKKFATGGVVPGRGNGDTVPAMLTPGEVVLTKEEAKNNPILIAAIQNGSVMKYNGGTGKRQTSPGKTGFDIGGESFGLAISPKSDKIVAQVEKLATAMQDGSLGVENGADVLKEVFARLADDSRVTITEFVQELRIATKQMAGIELSPAQINTAAGATGPNDKLVGHSAGEAGVSKNVREQMYAAGRGEEYERLQTIANNTGDRLASERPDLPRLQRPDKKNVQLDRGHIGAIGTTEKGVQEGWDADLWDLSTHAENEMAQTLASNNDARRVYLEKLKQSSATEEEILSISQKVTSNGALNERELQIQKEVLGSMLADKNFMAAEQKKAGKGKAMSIEKTMLATVYDAEGRSAIPVPSGADTRSTEERLASGRAKVRGRFGKNNSPEVGSDAGFVPLSDSERAARLDSLKISKDVDADLAAAEKKAETASPSKRTKRLGKDIADGLAQGLEEGTPGVKAKSSQLTDAALPSAAETQARVGKMDLGNKAFYDDIDTPEMRDERQVLKSLDRQRRKRGATGSVELPADKSSVKSKVRLAKKTQVQSQEIAKETGNIAKSTVLVAEETDEFANVTQAAIDAQTTNTSNLITTNQLTDAANNNLGEMLPAMDKAGVAQQDLADSSANIAKTNDQIDAEKKEQLAQLKAYNAQEAARMAAENGIVPPGSQTGNEELGKNRMGSVAAYEEASTYTRDKNGRILFDPELGADGKKQPTTLSAKQIKEKKRGMRREKVGRTSGKISGGLGTAAMVAGMAGAPPQVTAALGGAATVAQFAPMIAGLTGPQGIVVALAAVAAGAYLFNKHLNAMAGKAAQFAKDLSATRDGLKSIGEMTGRVGASEIMDKRRSTSQYGKYDEAVKINDVFGKQFLGSDPGKKEKALFQKNVKDFGQDKAVSDLALKLATGVADGVLDSDAANSIAAALAIDLKDAKLEMQVIGQMSALIGPDGEDLKKEPMKARIAIMAKAGQRTSNLENDISKKSGFGQSSRKEVAALAALNMNNLELATMMADQVQVEYDTTKKKLEAELASTTNAQKKLDLETQIATLNTQNLKDTQFMNDNISAQINKNAISFAKVYSGSVWGKQAMREDAYFDASRSQVKSTYKGTDQEDAAKKFLNKTEKLSSDTTTGKYNSKTGQYVKTGLGTAENAQKFQAKMEMLVGSKVLSPGEATSYMDLFSGKLNEMDFLLNAGIKTKGTAKTKELFGMFAGFSAGGRKQATSIITEMIMKKKDPAEFDSIMETIKSLQVMDGNTIDFEIMVKTIGLAGIEKIKKEQEDLEKAKDAAKKAGKDSLVGADGVSVEATADVSGNMKAATDALEKNKERMEQFKNGSLEQQTEYLQKLAAQMMYEATVNDKTREADIQFLAEQQAMNEAYLQGIAIGSDAYVKILEKNVAALKLLSDSDFAVKKVEMVGVGGVTSIDAPVVPKTPKGGGSNPLDFLDALAMRIKNVRDGAFDATKPLQSMLAAFSSPKVKKDMSTAFKVFDGLQQRMIGMKVPKEFRDMIAGMSSQDFKELANLKGDKAIFKFKKDKNGKALPRTKANIEGLTDTGKKMMKTYNEAIVGEGNVVNREVVEQISNQEKAFKILISEGATATEALEHVQDAALAAAIASGALGKEGSAERKQYIADLKKATDETERFALRQKMIQANEEFKLLQQMPKLGSAMKLAGFSADQMQEVLNDPALAKSLIEDLKDGKVDSKEIADYLNSIEARKMIDIQVNYNSGKFSESAQPGMDLVDEMFSVQESMLRTGADPKTNGMVKILQANEEKLIDLELAAKPFRREIELLNREIRGMEQDIEKTYTRPIEGLQEEISDLERTLEIDPKFGDRAMEAINNQNAKMSNDAAIMANQAETINDKYDKQAEALAKVAEINEDILNQQKSQLDIAGALTSGDISAAAKAVQEARAQSAQRFSGSLSQALEQSRANEIDGLRGAETGFSQKEIDQKQFENAQALYKMENDPARLKIVSDIRDKQDQIYKLEELREKKLADIQIKQDLILKKQIEQLQPLEDQIEDITYSNELIQAQIDKYVKGIEVLGKTQSEWDAVKAKIDANTLAGKNFDGQLGALLASTDAIDKKWQSILDKLASYNGIPQGVTDAKTQVEQNGVKADAEVAADIAAADAAKVAALDKAITGKDDAVKTANAVVSSTVPTPVKTAVTVKSGDTLSSIAKANGTTVSALQAANPVLMSNPKYNDGRTIFSGTKITIPAPKATSGGGGGGSGSMLFKSKGGLIPKYFARGGFARGTDTVPAMLTPGEFIVSKYGVNSYGADNLKKINNGDAPSRAVYNNTYTLTVNAKTNANPNEIAQAVMSTIKQVDDRRIRGVSLNGR
jgi:LysM repeat protein